MAEKAGVHAKAQEPKQKYSNFIKRKPHFNYSDSPADRILYFQQTAGNQAVQQLVKSRALQAKLSINQPGDVYEQEADRVAEQVMRMPDPVLQRKCPKCDEDEKKVLQAKNSSGKVPAALNQNISPLVNEVLHSPGQPLDFPTRAFMEKRFGHDFSRVRVHSGETAEQSARDMRALAYTMGHDIVFGMGRFSPGTHEGRRLIAHELTHVVQQRQGAYPKLQRSALRDFNDEDVKHDPSKLTDAQIEATREFKAYMDSKLKWQWQYKVTREEALLACRLVIRRMREGEAVIWERDAGDFLNRARKQLGTLKETEKLVGKLKWVGGSKEQFESPGTAESDFVRWLLAGGPEPTDVGKMNCWEMILFGATRGKIVSKDQVQNIYKTAAEKGNPPAEIENQLCGVSSNVTFNPADPRSPEPLPGDIIIFSVIENHAAIALGTTMIGGDHLVISLHASPAAPHSQVEITTLEQLLKDTRLTTAQLCRAPWRGKGRP